MAQFQHEPLVSKSWVRFVKVHRDLKDGHVCCSLQHFDSASGDCPAYVALSYMWGNPTPRHVIYINGQVRMVHESLWRFLYRTWLNKFTDWLWTDSLCIDQANYRELNQQVVRMGDIYSQARHVISWLGESKTGAQALRTMAEFGGASMGDAPFPDSPGLASPAAVSQVRRAWLRLIEEEPYWERVWVFQEVACARKSSVVYGPVEVDFEELLEQMSKAMYSLIWAHDKSRDPEELKQSWPAKLADLRSSIATSRRLDFMELLTKMSQGKCTRPVDRVYGLLGLAGRLDPEFNGQDLAVDYSKDLGDVWWDVLFTVLDAPEDSVLSVRDVTRTVNAALGRSAYEKTPPFDDNTFDRLSARGQKRARLACKIAHVMAEDNRHAWLAPPGVKEAAKHACSHKQAQLSSSGAGHDVLVVLCLLASLKQPVWSMLARCSAARVPVDGVSWLCAAHMSDEEVEREVEEEDVEGRGERMGVSDVVRQKYGACDQSLISSSSPSSDEGCSYCKVALELKDAGIVFCLTMLSPSSEPARTASTSSRDFSAVEWCCMACQIKR